MAAISKRAVHWRSVSTVIRLPWQRYPLASLIMGLLMVGGWSLLLFFSNPKVIYGALGAHAYALLFVGMLSAMVWTSVCRPETQTLPGFKRVLASVWAIYALLFVVLPGAMAYAYGLDGWLVASALLALLATSTATGSGVKWAGLIWLAPMLLGIWPDFAKEIWRTLTTSVLAPVLLVTVSVLIARVVWRRLLIVSDGAPTLSPADINASDLSSAADAARIRQAGGLAIWMQKVQHDASARAFDSILGRLQQQRPGADRRMLGMVLLPNAHWRGIALELLIAAVFVGILVLVIASQRGGPPPAGMAATYIGMLTALRFQQLHRATMMLRPSLVDVYFAAAPSSQLAFTAAIAAALRGALLPATLFGLLLLGIVSLMYPAEQRLAMIVGGGVGVYAGSLASLGVVLMLLDSERPRVILGLVVLGMVGAIPTSLCVAAASASPAAGAVVAALVLVAAFGFHQRAYQYATRWPIRFDAP